MIYPLTDFCVNLRGKQKKTKTPEYKVPLHFQWSEQQLGSNKLGRNMQPNLAKVKERDSIRLPAVH